MNPASSVRQCYKDSFLKKMKGRNFLGAQNGVQGNKYVRK